MAGEIVSTLLFQIRKTVIEMAKANTTKVGKIRAKDLGSITLVGLVECTQTTPICLQLD